jgi:hypothetical protein
MQFSYKTKTEERLIVMNIGNSGYVGALLNFELSGFELYISGARINITFLMDKKVFNF